MADENAEVRVKLVADDLSKAVVDGVMASMKALREEQEKTTKAAGEGASAAMRGAREEGEKAAHAAGHGGLAGELLKANLATELIKGGAELVTEAFHQAYEMTEKLVDAAMEAADAEEKQVRTMSGNLFLIDQGRHGMGAIKDYSRDMREEFAKAGVNMGVTTASITEAFNQIVSRGTMGSEKAKELAIQMTEVGKIVPGGMESLSQGFSMVELGMVRAKNPIVQLIAATHTLQGNAHSVAAAMQKMTPEKQMELAEKAIAKQAESLKKMGGLGPATMPELKTSFEGVKESFLESMGKPIEDALIPHLTALRNFLSEHIEEIKRYGQIIGQKIGQVIEYISAVVQGLYQGIAQDWGQIQAIFEDVFGDWMRAWDSTVKDSASIREEFTQMAHAFVGILKPILETIKATVEVAMQANDLLHGRSMHATEAGIRKQSAESEATNAVEGGKSMKDIDLEIQKYRQLALETGVSKESADAYAASLHDQAEASMQASAQAKDSLASGNFDAFNTYVDGAIKAQSDGAEEYAFKLLEGSEEGRRALLAGADHIGGGLDALMKVIGDKAPELARQLKEMQSGRVGKEGIIPPAHNINFNGSHFQIHQDFKDQDPDRLMVLFRQDLAKAARNRIESRSSTPFGL
jgi:hypothetical protein